MAKEIKLTEGTKQALNLLKQADGPVTLRELNEIAPEGIKIAPAHMNALKRYEFADAEKVEREVVQKTEVNVYSYTGKEYNEDED